MQCDILAHMSKEVLVPLSEVNNFGNQLFAKLDLTPKLEREIGFNTEEIDRLRLICDFEKVLIIRDQESNISGCVPQIDNNGLVIYRRMFIKNASVGNYCFENSDKKSENKTNRINLKILLNVDEIEGKIFSMRQIENEEGVLWSKEINKIVKGTILKAGTKHLLERSVDSIDNAVILNIYGRLGRAVVKPMPDKK